MVIGLLLYHFFCRCWKEQLTPAVCWQFILRYVVYLIGPFQGLNYGVWGGMKWLLNLESWLHFRLYRGLGRERNWPWGVIPSRAIKFPLIYFCMAFVICHQVVSPSKWYHWQLDWPFHVRGHKLDRTSTGAGQPTSTVGYTIPCDNTKLLLTGDTRFTVTRLLKI